MIIEARFFSAQANLGYQFYDGTGALIGTRVTTGITSTPETGAYIADAEIPDAAVGVYWNDTVTLAESSESLIISRAFAGATVDDPVVAPEPPAGTGLCTVYVYTESLIGVQRAGISISFSLFGVPAKSGRVLDTTPVTMTTDANGYASITLQRTDAMTPTGRSYRVNCPVLGLSKAVMTLADSTFNLAGLIT